MRTIEEIKAKISLVEQAKKEEKGDDPRMIEVLTDLLNADIKEFIETVIDGIPLDRLKTICDAEREGNLLILEGRCKECKSWSVKNCRYDISYGHYRGQDDFCSRFEHRETAEKEREKP